LAAAIAGLKPLQANASFDHLCFLSEGFSISPASGGKKNLGFFVGSLQRPDHFACQDLDLLMPYLERSAWAHDELGGAGLDIVFDCLPHLFRPAQRCEIERR
jgi:hypothetical protein